MMDSCSVLPAGAGFISSMTAYIDCQAQVLGTGAWQALAAPGSTLSAVLAGFLTIFIALIGYNLLFGRGMGVRSWTLALVKIGAVFALATSWPAYRTLVYDVVTKGPAQLVAEVGPRAGVLGSDGTLLQRLDLVDQGLTQLAILGPGDAPARGTAPPPFTGFDALALGGARIMFLLTAVAGLGVVSIVTGLMLALGPFFVAFLMFENTRSLFEGWVRALAGAALAAFGVAIAFGLELALLDPWLRNVLARRMAGETLPTVAAELFVIACLFAIIVLAVLVSCARVARAFRLAPLMQVIPIAMQQQLQSTALPLRQNGTSSERVEPERSRATALASTLVGMDRRRRTEVPRPGQVATATVAPVAGSMISAAAREPVGRSFARRPRTRHSASAAIRDGGK